MRSPWRDLAMGAAMALLCLPAQAEGGIQVGFLTCEVSRGFGFIFGSSRDLDCTFSDATGKKASGYKGAISTFGVDIGYVQGGIIAWAVLAPTRDVGAGALEGQYAGLSASATPGAGVGANVLVGGSERAISLQPVSVSGAIGLNAAAGITAISLTALR